MQSPRLARLQSDPSPGAVDEFWAEVTAAGTPLVEPWGDGTVLVTFLWRGEARSTKAWWGVDVPLTRLPGTDLWSGSQVFPADLRTIYCLTHDGLEDVPADASGTGPTHIDPLNPQRFLFPADPADAVDTDFWISVLSLDRAPAEPWLEPRPGTPAGTVTETTLPGDPRPVAVYCPPSAGAAGLPVLVVFDGYLARHVLRVPTILDNLIGAGRIPPMVALFVSNFCDTREDELTPGPALLSYVTGDLLPWARARFGAGLDGRANIVTGASRGGLAAAYLGLHAPAEFGAVIAQSGSFWWPAPDQGEPGRLIRDVAEQPRSGVHFYLDVGINETMTGPGGAPSQLAVNRAMRDALRDRGFQVDYTEYTGGHDYLNWRRTLADALITVSGVRTS